MLDQYLNDPAYRPYVIAAAAIVLAIIIKIKSHYRRKKQQELYGTKGTDKYKRR